MCKVIGYVAMALVIGAWFAIGIIGKYWERRDFNHGICPICGEKLKYFDSDSQGGRGYMCYNDYYSAWVSYDSVDRDYWKREKENL